MTVSADTFRHVLAYLAGGVAVVTSRASDGRPRGLTATAVCSVSLSPPLVLACLENGSRTRAAIHESGAYAINLIGADQPELALRFSARPPDKFDGVALEEGTTGVPLLLDAAGYCDCRVVESVEAGDHTVYVGRVEDAAVRGLPGHHPRPLVRWLGRYLSVGPPFGGSLDNGEH